MEVTLTGYGNKKKKQLKWMVRSRSVDWGKNEKNSKRMYQILQLNCHGYFSSRSFIKLGKLKTS